LRPDKLLGQFHDENSARDIAQVTAIFDRLCDETKAASIYAQHYSKGNQAGKESIDRAAGSGVWARDADSIIAMTKHKEEECLTVETTLRSFPRIDPFVVRWDFPLFVRDPKLDPADLKQPNQGRHAIYSIEDLLECLGDESLRTTDLKKRFEEEIGGSKGTFHKLLKVAEENGVLHKSKVDGRWEKILPPKPV
jgi:hypothetical protein